MAIINPYYPTIHYRERYYKPAPDFAAITATRTYQDGGKSFNESGDDPPQTWEMVYVFDKRRPEQLAFLEIFDAHFRDRRYSRPFPFVEKDGNIVVNAYYKEYQPQHEAHKSWLQRRIITIAYYPSAASTDILPPSVPEPLTVEILSSVGALFKWTASASVAPIEGYELNVDGSVYAVGNITEYAFGFNEANTTHSVKVRAFDENGTRSQYTDPVVFTLRDTVGIPSVPANVQVNANSVSSYTVTWNASTDT